MCFVFCFSRLRSGLGCSPRNTGPAVSSRVSQPAHSPQPFSVIVIIIIIIQVEINKCCCRPRSYSRCHNFANYEGHDQGHSQKIGADQIGFRDLLPHVRLLFIIWETKLYGLFLSYPTGSQTGTNLQHVVS